MKRYLGILLVSFLLLSCGMLDTFDNEDEGDSTPPASEAVGSDDEDD